MNETAVGRGAEGCQVTCEDCDEPSEIVVPSPARTGATESSSLAIERFAAASIVGGKL
jgi:hypothetical protein